MDPQSEKRLRLFVNPFAIWTELAFKTGQAMLATAHAAALRANAPRVAVIPTVDAPPPKEMQAAPQPKEMPHASTPVRHAPKAMRFKASRAKTRNADKKRRARRRAAR